MVHVKWEPFKDLMAMQDRMTRLFDETLFRLWKQEGLPRAAWTPPVDILERGGELILKIDLPEVDQSEIEIKVEGDTLIIQGERKFTRENNETYLQIERPYGAFHRHFTIPKMIDSEKIKAGYKDGVLRVILPKRQQIHLQRVSVEEE